jgi:serpin B
VAVVLSASTFLLAGMLLGCAEEGVAGPGGGTGPAEVTILKSDVQRDLAAQVAQATLDALVAGNSAFAFDMYGELRDKEGNLFYSPYSISLALAMAYAGARTSSEQQMAAAMHYTLSQDSLHPAFNVLDLELASRGEGAQGQDGQPFRLRIANAAWGQKDYSFQQSYLDVLGRNYGSGMVLLDFVADPEACRLTINGWVSDSTEGRIKDLIPQGAIDALTRLVLTNAVYFNAAWESQFEESVTVDGPFVRLDGSTVSAPFMNQAEYFGYVDGDGYQAVELLYDGRELSMVVIVPDSGAFTAFEGSLSHTAVASVTQGLQQQRVALAMPKFSFSSGSISLKPILTSLGMPVVFEPVQADFSGIDGSRDLHVSDVLHKAFVAVDERGTEAAAATAVIIGATSMPPPPIPVNVDRPFVFLIRDIQTGAVLFVGRVLDPTA